MVREERPNSFLKRICTGYIIRKHMEIKKEYNGERKR